VSGRSKPPSVHCGIQLCAIPGRTPGRPIALFWLAPAGVRRFTVSFPSTHQRVTRTRLPGASSPVVRLNRIIAQGRPCRFCAIAVAPATRTCIRLRTRPVGGLSSAALRHRQPHSPSRVYHGGCKIIRAALDTSYITSITCGFWLIYFPHNLKSPQGLSGLFVVSRKQYVLPL